MVVGGKRKGDQDRCHSCRCDFTHTSGAGTSEYQIGLCKRTGHIANERNNFAFQPGGGELSREILRVIHSTLMDDPDWDTSASEQRPAFARRPVQCPRAAAAAGNQ